MLFFINEKTKRKQKQMEYKNYVYNFMNTQFVCDGSHEEHRFEYIRIALIYINTFMHFQMKLHFIESFIFLIFGLKIFKSP